MPASLFEKAFFEKRGLARSGARSERTLPGLSPATVPRSDLTTSDLTAHDAEFVGEARRRGELYIQQPYELYSAENHEAWGRLSERMRPRWEEYANDHFLAGIRSLCLDPKHIPRLNDVNGFLRPLTGFTARAVSGYVPAFLFFDCLRNREFPTTVTIRRSDQLDYLPEPDIFHDIAGHVPMHTDPQFAEALVRFGECAHGGGRGARDQRRIRASPLPDQHHQGYGPVFLVHHRIWLDAVTTEFRMDEFRQEPAGLLKRTAELLR
jgi:hypothetical protein